MNKTDQVSGPLSAYQVSFNFLVYFQRYAPDNPFITKMKRGSNSVNTVDIVMVLALCNSPHGPLSVYQVSLNQGGESRGLNDRVHGISYRYSDKTCKKIIIFPLTPTG